MQPRINFENGKFSKDIKLNSQKINPTMKWRKREKLLKKTLKFVNLYSKLENFQSECNSFFNQLFFMQDDKNLKDEGKSLPLLEMRKFSLSFEFFF